MDITERGARVFQAKICRRVVELGDMADDVKCAMTHGNKYTTVQNGNNPVYYGMVWHDYFYK